MPTPPPSLCIILVLVDDSVSPLHGDLTSMTTYMRMSICIVVVVVHQWRRAHLTSFMTLAKNIDVT